MNVNVLIGVLIFFIVGLVLTPVINSVAKTATSDANASALQKTIIGLVPVFWILIILVASAAVFYSKRGT